MAHTHNRRSSTGSCSRRSCATSTSLSRYELCIYLANTGMPTDGCMNGCMYAWNRRMNQSQYPTPPKNTTHNPPPHPHPPTQKVEDDTGLTAQQVGRYRHHVDFLRGLNDPRVTQRFLPGFIRYETDDGGNKFFWGALSLFFIYIYSVCLSFGLAGLGRPPRHAAVLARVHSL